MLKWLKKKIKKMRNKEKYLWISDKELDTNFPIKSGKRPQYLKSILLLVFAGCLMLVSGGEVAMAEFNDHPRFAVLNTKASAFVNAIHDAQGQYFLANNKYFQGLITPDYPTDGMTDLGSSNGVNWSKHPSDQEDSWKDFSSVAFASDVTVPFQIRIDVYQSVDGWGWILTIDVRYDGLGPDALGNEGPHWIYRHHEGPEDFPEEYQDTWVVVVDL